MTSNDVIKVEFHDVKWTDSRKGLKSDFTLSIRAVFLSFFDADKHEFTMFDDAECKDILHVYLADEFNVQPLSFSFKILQSSSKKPEKTRGRLCH